MSEKELRELLVARMSEALDCHGPLADSDHCECGYIDAFGSIGLHQLEVQAEAVMELLPLDPPSTVVELVTQALHAPCEEAYRQWADQGITGKLWHSDSLHRPVAELAVAALTPYLGGPA